MGVSGHRAKGAWYDGSVGYKDRKRVSGVIGFWDEGVSQGRTCVASNDVEGKDP